MIAAGICLADSKSSSEIIHFSSYQNEPIKVMTFNIRVDTFIDFFNGWSHRKNIVFDTLADYAADVICLQEALPNQVQDIQRALPQYNNYSIGRNDGKKKGESCAIFYRKDRFVLDDCGTFWFSDTPQKPGSKDWGSLWPRICTWVRLIKKQTGKAFYVYNVHLDPLSQGARKKSTKLLAKNIADRKTEDPFIVMGDFNMALKNPAMKYLHNANNTAHPEMINAWQCLNPKLSPGTSHNFTGRAFGAKIDHISVCEDAKVLAVNIDRRQVNGRYPSDHFPVIAKILLK